MNKKSLLILLIILLLCAIPFAYNMGKNSVNNTDNNEYLYELNRSELEKLVFIDGPTYVIGHKASDSDTVCSAIAYANLLNKLGIDAKAMITGPINNETKYILEKTNIQIPEILYDASNTNIIMVDHSEYAQAVDNLIDGNIVGIIDHHGVGSINVGHQVLYNAKPIGSTATIVWLNFLNYGIDIDEDIAQILLGAILSDTDNLTSSTTIDLDKKAYDALLQICKIEDVDKYYQELHERYLSYDGLTDEQIFFSDYKEYEISEIKFGIGAVNAIDEENAAKLAKQMKEVLIQIESTTDTDLIYASVRAENKKIDYIVPGNEYSEAVFKAAFPNYDEYDGYAYIFKSSLGRKSKFVPGLTDYLASKPHE